MDDRIEVLDSKPPSRRERGDRGVETLQLPPPSRSYTSGLNLPRCCLFPLGRCRKREYKGEKSVGSAAIIEGNSRPDTISLMFSACPPRGLSQVPLSVYVYRA